VKTISSGSRTIITGYEAPLSVNCRPIGRNNVWNSPKTITFAYNSPTTSRLEKFLTGSTILSRRDSLSIKTPPRDCQGNGKVILSLMVFLCLWYSDNVMVFRG
jgi:hypothetical protein